LKEPFVADHGLPCQFIAANQIGLRLRHSVT
jgi:hypothetical protein